MRWNYRSRKQLHLTFEGSIPSSFSCFRILDLAKKKLCQFHFWVFFLGRCKFTSWSGYISHAFHMNCKQWETWRKKSTPTDPGRQLCSGHSDPTFRLHLSSQTWVLPLRRFVWHFFCVAKGKAKGFQHEVRILFSWWLIESIFFI